MTKQIGLYGGSFDPIHLGHLSLAIEIKEAHALDEVWFCPTPHNPHKTHGTLAHTQHRIDMLQCALEGMRGFHICEAEIGRSPPIYTLDTLRQLAAEETAKEVPAMFSLILGDDAAHSFAKWHQPEEILKYARMLVGRRIIDDNDKGFEGSSVVVEALNKGLTPTRIMEISSTEVRLRLSKGLCCVHLLPRKVLDYIQAHDLYLVTK